MVNRVARHHRHVEEETRMRAHRPAMSPSSPSSTSRHDYGVGGSSAGNGVRTAPMSSSSTSSYGAGVNQQHGYHHHSPSSYYPGTHSSHPATGSSYAIPPQQQYEQGYHGRTDGGVSTTSPTSAMTLPPPPSSFHHINSPQQKSVYNYERADAGPSSAVNAGQQQQKIKRAKSTQKITRNRKITSCLQCRERKQKCDRKRPICSNCMTGNSRGGMCTYVDTPEGVQEVLANEGERDAKRMKHSPTAIGGGGGFEDGDDDEVDEEGSPAAMIGFSTTGPPPAFTATAVAPPQEGRLRTTSISSGRPTLPSQSPLTVRRINLIAATERAGKDRSLDFEARVRYARAAAMGTILFGTPPPTFNAAHQLYHPLAAVDSLKLPMANEMGAYLDTYRRYVEWMCNVVIVDLNRARFESFLNWWHSNPQTLPADPPLVPLVLTVLALALQARRMAGHCTLSLSQRRRASDHRDGKSGRSSSTAVRRERGKSPGEPFLASISSEKELLETAQRCIDALQIVCPSNSASAFSAPLDLVRASLLRGIWHLTELHLQFAGSCFATTVRLAHAASLHHDTRHWPTMGKEEAQARRNIFWNVAMFESSFALRVTQPTVMLPASSSDTNFPEDYEALLNLYRYGGLIEPFITEGRRSHFRVRPLTKASFEFHLARFQLTSILMNCPDMLKAGKQAALAAKLQTWRESLPDEVRFYLDDEEEEAASKTGVESRQKEELDAETHHLQRCMLRMMNLSTSIQIHRPQADENGKWLAPDGQAHRSLDECIKSAQQLIRLIHAILSRDPGPPFVLFHQCVFQCFQAAIVIAIQSALSSKSNNPSRFNSPTLAALESKSSMDMALEILDTVAGQDALRNIAEQAGRYAATLRDIHASQQARLVGRSVGGKTSTGHSREATVEAADLSASQNVHRSGVGVPAVIMAEGDGKMLGGQGYPLDPLARRSASAKAQGTSSPSTGVRGLWHAGHTILPDLQGVDGVKMEYGGGGTDTMGKLPTIASMQASDVQYPFAIDFSDLQVFGHPDPVQAQRMGMGALDGTFIDRPVPIPDGPMNVSLLGGNAAAETADMVWSSADGGMGGTSAWPSAGEADDGFQQTGSTTAVLNGGGAMALGDSFAMDWTEWERAVERLLHSER